LLDWPDTCPRRVTCQNEAEQCPGACVIPIQAREPSAESCKEGLDCLKTGGLLQNGRTPLPDGPHTCPRQVMRKNESEQCNRACLIPIQACEPSAAPCKEGVDCLKTGGLLQNGWTPLPDWRDTCPRRVTCQNASEQCTKEGVDCLQTDGLLRNG
jgi:hypothetical protein